MLELTQIRIFSSKLSTYQSIYAYHYYFIVLDIVLDIQSRKFSKYSFVLTGGFNRYSVIKVSSENSLNITNGFLSNVDFYKWCFILSAKSTICK